MNIENGTGINVVLRTRHNEKQPFEYEVVPETYDAPNHTKQYAESIELYANLEDMFNTYPHLKKEKKPRTETTTQQPRPFNSEQAQNELLETQILELVTRERLAHTQETLFRFENGHYQIISDSELDELLKRNIGLYALLSSSQHAGLKRIVKVLALQRFRTLNPQGEWVAFKNKTLNYRTSEEGTPSSSTFFLNSIPHAISDSTQTPNFDRVVSGIVGADKLTLIKDLFAYSTLPENPLKIIVFLHSEHHDSGKSTLLRVLERFVGSKNTKSTTFGVLSDPKQRFELVGLRGKLLTTCSEIDGSTLYHTSILKLLSGMDTLRGERKNSNESFDFVFGGKLFITTNTLPQLKNATDKAFMSRCVVVECPHQFRRTGVPVEHTIPESEYEALARYSYDKLKEWALKGDISIINLPTIAERISEYTANTDPLAIFIEQNITFDSMFDEGTDYGWEYSYTISCAEFLDRFNNWLQARGKKPVHYTSMGVMLKTRYKDRFERRKTKTYQDEEQKWYYYGMCFKEKKPKQTQVPKQSDLNSIHGNEVQPLRSLGLLRISSETPEFEPLFPVENCQEPQKAEFSDEIQLYKPYDSCQRVRSGVLHLLSTQPDQSMNISDLMKHSPSVTDTLISELKIEGLVFEPRAGVLRLI